MVLFRIDLFFAVALFSVLAPSSLGQNQDICRKSCGNQRIEYPFGIDEGCGDPWHRLECVNDTNLSIGVQSALAPITIDYSGQVITINTTTILQAELRMQQCHLPLNQSAYDVEEDTSLIICLGEGVPFEAEYVLGTCLLEQGSQTSSGGLPLTCYSYTKKEAARSPESVQRFPFAWLSYASIKWVPSPFENQCTACNAGGGICGYNASDGFLCICSHGNTTTSSCEGSAGKSGSNKTLLYGAAGGAAAFTAVLCLITGCCILKRKQATRRRRVISRTSSDQTFTAENIQSLFSWKDARLFSFEELERATRCFTDDLKLGSGGFGTVYKGTLHDNSVVAIKRSNRAGAQDSRQFLNEVTILSQVNHRNLVRLMGCCIETEIPLLVYEYVANGTLFEHLQGQRGTTLSWEKRLQIAIETAEALSYLHSAAFPPIYHRDVKSSNILLDGSLAAKVADFGISKLVPVEATHVSTLVQGTLGYLDPEYFQNCRFTDKSDVYSFGVVLLELITGQKPIDFSRDSTNINLVAFSSRLIKRDTIEEMIDPRLQFMLDCIVTTSMKKVANLAAECLSSVREDRPNMKQVVEELYNIRGSGRTAPQDRRQSAHDEHGGWPNNIHDALTSTSTYLQR